MPLTLSRFLSRPLTLKDRDKIAARAVSIQNIIEEKNGWAISMEVRSASDPKKKYSCVIWTKDEDLSAKSRCKFFCSCPSFQFQFESTLAEHDALYGDPRSAKAPKKDIVYVCKHLEAAIHHLITKKNIQHIMVSHNRRAQ